MKNLDFGCEHLTIRAPNFCPKRAVKRAAFGSPGAVDRFAARTLREMKALFFLFS
jgi:hypothetical protein